MCNLKVKKSKFYGFIFPFDDPSKLDLYMNNIKEEYKKATHYIYAYKVGNYKKADSDKEPSGAGGNTTLTLMDKMNIDNYLIIIVRYYGGKKLGLGPLIRTYNDIVKALVEDNITE